MKPNFAQIIVNNRSSQVDKPYTYIIDESMQDIIEIGMRVIIPFGRGNKPIKGIVIGFIDKYEEGFKLKKIMDIIDDKPLISKELIDLSIWMKDYYISSYIDAFQPIFPPGDFKEINTYVELITSSWNHTLTQDENLILDYLKPRKRIALEDLRKNINLQRMMDILLGLENKNLIEITIDVKSKVNRKYEKWVKLSDEDIPLDTMLEIIGNRASKQREIIEYIFPLKNISFKELSIDLKTSLATVRELENKGLVSIYDLEVNRNPISKSIKEYKKHSLTIEQNQVYQSIVKSIEDKSDKNKFLIHGVTGSGKTEIYLQLVEKVLEEGKDSIVLVPEISLTPQTIDRFVGRFGDAVAVLHSRLSYGERFDQWRRIKSGKVKIVVGARSAVFAPFKNLGLIIIDEEHEGTYKSSQNPKYHTVEVAGRRADIEGAFLVLGSATPSLETYHNAQNNEFVLLELQDRINKKILPRVKIIDMREELNKGNKSIFSEELYRSMVENLENNKQTILFLNRRGFSTFISCRKCGYVVKCNDCDISMTYHRNINKLKCHYCGLAINPPQICPACKSNYIKYFGIGTEKVEEITRELFPKARIERMDMDTTSEKGSHEKILNKMKKGNIDILIGTQMISKGLDFENVTLVGILAADTTLNLPDYRSSERTFQLVTQVAGRAGRGDSEGKVVLQTYMPEHYSINYAKTHDFQSFYDTEMALRKEFLFPPYINLSSILIYGENNNQVASLAKEVYNLLVANIEWLDKDNIQSYIIGPYPAPIERIKNNFRWQILVKSQKGDMDSLKTVLKRVIIDNKYNLKMDNIKFSIDIDPSTIL